LSHRGYDAGIVEQTAHALFALRRDRSRYTAKGDCHQEAPPPWPKLGTQFVGAISPKISHFTTAVLIESGAAATLTEFWRIGAMTPQKLARNLSLMSLISKSVGLSAGIALLLASGSAFALNKNQAAATSQPQMSQHTILAQGVEEKTQPQESQPDSEIQSSQQPRFTCEQVNGQYTVMYHPESQPNQAYPWATPNALGGGWTPERRCNEISRRLELYRPDGLVEMRNAVENNYNTVCVTTQKNSSCRIVLTVPPGQDPEVTRDRVFQNLTIADSGERTDAVNTFVAGDRSSQLLNQALSALGIGNNPVRHSNSINLRPFLDRADGGTASKLIRGIQARPNPRLNPDRFR
jgi:hypothetical protein